MIFTREADNIDLKIRNKKCIKIVENTLNKRETDILNSKNTIYTNTLTMTRKQKLKLVEEMQNSIEKKLRLFSPYHNGRKNPNFTPMHNKFVTIVGDKEKFDPLFNYEYQRIITNETEDEKEKEEEEEKTNNKQFITEKISKKINEKFLNFKILKKRQKQNIRKMPNSYYGQFKTKSSNYCSNSFFDNNKADNDKEIISDEDDKFKIGIKSKEKNFDEIHSKNNNDLNGKLNKIRINDFMTLEVNDPKINNLQLNKDKKKEAFFGKKKIAYDEHVNNKRTYLEEFSSKNDEIQVFKLNNIVKERQNLQAIVLNETKILQEKNSKSKTILQNENKNVPLEDKFTKDFSKEKAYFKALNYENIRKSLKAYDNSRKALRDYYKMNDKLIKDFIYSDRE